MCVCVPVFLSQGCMGVRVCRPAGSERSSAQTSIYSHAKTIFIYLLCPKTEAECSPPREYGMRVQSGSRGAHAVFTDSEPVRHVELGVYVCARSHAIIHPCMHVFLDRALGRTADNERSSAQTSTYSYVKTMFLYLLCLQAEAQCSPPRDYGMQHRRM